MGLWLPLLCSKYSTPENQLLTKSCPSCFHGLPPGYKGYMLLNLHTNQFFISRDVTFIETTFPFTTLSTDTYHDPPPSHNQLAPNPNPNQPQIHYQPAHANPSNVRRSTRARREPPQLQDYVHHTKYPIGQYLTYSKLSAPYPTFVFQVNSHYEHQYYHQAVKYPQWREAMAAKLVALESNNTWTIVPLPPNK